MARMDEHGNPVPFSLVFSTANREKGTGGEIIEVKKAVLMKSRRKAASGQHAKTPLRKANEHENSIRNIWCLTTERPYAVHIRLIDQFNSTTIIW